MDIDVDANSPETDIFLHIHKVNKDLVEQLNIIGYEEFESRARKVKT